MKISRSVINPPLLFTPHITDELTTVKKCRICVFIVNPLFQFEISKEKIATLCAECERYIGTQGGGMDQAIAFLATEGEFNSSWKISRSYDRFFNGNYTFTYTINYYLKTL